MLCLFSKCSGVQMLNEMVLIPVIAYTVLPAKVPDK